MLIRCAIFIKRRKLLAQPALAKRLDDLFSIDFLAEIEEKSQNGICCAYVTEEEEL